MTEHGVILLGGMVLGWVGSRWMSHVLWHRAVRKLMRERIEWL